LIGRASKSITKGLFSAVDNAWFDSPVMSRDHAQFTLKVEDKVRFPGIFCGLDHTNAYQTISIEDIGSMHGTYLNGVELARHVPSILNNGDFVVFGAEVRRGPETFPACGFNIAVEFIEPM
jgi:pSer/pThr/pTyr-binding forkhead associated (FHA) protein